ncbi:uncharacterized protein LOC130969545 isoform X1 [Arachis stenosperma]|uniref:uncharacterized protein LOC130969545 isoform X1 n=2 Tax=Arachis stenosperma TaxID=217475 RepID=UPI0025AD9A1F|nr:uncharacterized protein LOC130969545 isoform X1 [Arachis stenosperma]XP_057751300.1 uncharacterized protein LOC130969545 isoform X1 [Arachis stenosperma]
MAPRGLLPRRHVQLAVTPHHRRRRRQERQERERERGMNSRGREMRLRYAPVRAIVAPVAAASDDGAVAKARVTVVLAPVADEAHPFLLPWFAERETRGWRKADGEKNAVDRGKTLLSCFMVAVMEPASPSPMAAALTAALFGSVLSCAALWVVTNNSCQSHQRHCYSSNSASLPLGTAISLLLFFCWSYLEC